MLVPFPDFHRHTSCSRAQGCKHKADQSLYKCVLSSISLSVIFLPVFFQVCRDRKCQNASFTELESCLANCHGNGVSAHSHQHAHPHARTHMVSCNILNSLSFQAHLPNLVVSLCPWAKVARCSAFTKSVVKVKKIDDWNTTATEVMNYSLKQYKQA